MISGNIWYAAAPLLLLTHDTFCEGTAVSSPPPPPSSSSSSSSLVYSLHDLTDCMRKRSFLDALQLIPDYFQRVA